MTSEPIDPGRVAALLLRLRQDTKARSNLRRGHSPNTDHYAYPYLATLWMHHGEWFRDPLLRVGALAATSQSIGDDPDTSLGNFLRRSTLATVAQDGSDAKARAIERTGRRLVWAQTGGVEKLHIVLRNLVPKSPLAAPAVAWRDVVATYLCWDLPDAHDQRQHRRQLLEQYYRDTRDTTSADSSTNV